LSSSSLTKHEPLAGRQQGPNALQQPMTKSIRFMS
jgi:hypothetical protein